ncbi:hypothetical protein L3V86_08325 [Thiotrichales bacterium 19S11-10]|nr:hypothetical protein [Thiotrichales bacterium 19S11-10]
MRRLKVTEESKKYADHYQVLETINSKLNEGQDSPTIIDELADLLETASKSYKICKERIASAEKFLTDFEKKTEADG